MSEIYSGGGSRLTLRESGSSRVSAIKYAWFEVNIKYRGGAVPASVLEDLRARRGEGWGVVCPLLRLAYEVWSRKTLTLPTPFFLLPLPSLPHLLPHADRGLRLDVVRFLFLIGMRGRMLPSLSTLLKLLEMSRASSDGRTWIVCRCHFPRHFDAYFTGITRVKNGNGDINIRGGVHTWWVARTGAQSPAELRQFNNGTCLIIHSIENNPANRRNNYYRNVTLRHGIISVGAILIIGGTLLPGLTRVITFTWP